MTGGANPMRPVRLGLLALAMAGLLMAGMAGSTRACDEECPVDEYYSDADEVCVPKDKKTS